MNIAICQRILAGLAITGLSACGGGGGYGGKGGPSGASYTVGGTVTGLTGTVVLRNNGGDDLTITSNAAFTFSSRVANGGGYSVTVRTQPSFPAQACTVASGAGTIGTGNITNVTVTCASLPAADVQSVAGVHSATLTWSPPAEAGFFNVLVAQERNCDFEHFETCASGGFFRNATSPFTVPDLQNGQAYFFVVETVYANGAHGLSNKTGTRPNALAFDGAIHASAIAGDGTVYVGGEFNEVGITTGGAVPIDVRTRRVAAPDFPIVSGLVSAMAADGAGGWFIGGLFSRVGGEPRENLAHILADGTVDERFHPTADAKVEALAVAGGVVYAGGSFTRIDTGANIEVRNHLAAFNMAGDLLDWDPDTDGVVVALAAANGLIYIGGDFGFIGPTRRNFIAAVDTDGLLQAWDPDANATVEVLAVSGTTVYAGGEFISIGGELRNHLAAIDDQGHATAWNPNANGHVRALAISGTTVYAGGNFETMVGLPGNQPQSRFSLAAIDVNGALLDWNPNADVGVLALAVVGETVYAGGAFSTIGAGPTAQARRSIAAIGPDGRALDSTPAAGGVVRALAVTDTTVYMGGSMRFLDGSERGNIAALDATGTLLPWHPRLDGPVRALAAASDVLYAGGSFTDIDGTPRDRLAAFDAQGILSEWNPGADARVDALIVHNDVVYIGGTFSEVGGEPRSHLAAVEIGGGLREWQPQADGDVSALAAMGETIYAGGRFLQVNGAFHKCLVGLVATGEATDAVRDIVDTPDLTCSSVAALAVVNDTVYFGGLFDGADGQRRRNLASFVATGRLDAWNPEPDGAVLALNFFADTHTLYVGGNFTEITATPQAQRQSRTRLAAFDAFEVIDELLEWNPEADDSVETLAVSGSTVYAGGAFNTLGRSPRSAFGAIAGSTGAVIN